MRTALVNNVTLSEVSTVLGLRHYLRFFPSAESKGQIDRSKKGMLADCFEGLLCKTKKLYNLKLIIIIPSSSFGWSYLFGSRFKRSRSFYKSYGFI